MSEFSVTRSLSSQSKTLDTFTLTTLVSVKDDARDLLEKYSQALLESF